MIILSSSHSWTCFIVGAKDAILQLSFSPLLRDPRTILCTELEQAMEVRNGRSSMTLVVPLPRFATKQKTTEYGGTLEYIYWTLGVRCTTFGLQMRLLVLREIISADVRSL